MMRANTFLAACLLDLGCGDPEWLPHPVRLMGKGIDAGESLLRRKASSPRRELTSGAVLAGALPAAAALLSYLLIQRARSYTPRAAWCVEAILAWTCLAARNLLDESSQVVRALEDDKLVEARAHLSRIVGRDTQALDASEVSRAVIETLAESLSDGIIAPLFYLTLGGVPGAMAYKAVNTLDSMVGHKDERYLYFGRASARLDDAANYLPARLSAGLICAAAFVLPATSGARAYRAWLSDGYKHASPNAGQPESSMAGALGVRLGGDNYYDGRLRQSEHMGADLPLASIATARTALRVTALASLLGCVAVFILLKATQRD